MRTSLSPSSALCALALTRARCAHAGKDLPPTELQPADDFALLAAQALVSAFHLSRASLSASLSFLGARRDSTTRADDRTYLERALVLAEHALQHSKFKYQLRLVAINLLRQLGAPSLALAHYRTFGVKNIQHDTLSHVVLARSATFAVEQGGAKGAPPGVWEDARATEAWYTGGQREAGDMVVKAFSYGAYAKVRSSLLPLSPYPVPTAALTFVAPARRSRTFRRSATSSTRASRARSCASRRSGCASCARSSTRTTSKRRSRTSIGSSRLRLVRRSLSLARALSLAAQGSGVDEPHRRADSYSDNRDFKTLPNYQRKGTRTIWEQTELAERQEVRLEASLPRRASGLRVARLTDELLSLFLQASWLRAVAGAYARFLSPSTDVPAVEPPASVRPSLPSSPPCVAERPLADALSSPAAHPLRGGARRVRPAGPSRTRRVARGGATQGAGGGGFLQGCARPSSAFSLPLVEPSAARSLTLFPRSQSKASSSLQRSTTRRRCRGRSCRSSRSRSRCVPFLSSLSPCPRALARA